MHTNIKLYESEKYGYILELWGGSTKHPDSTFYFSDFEKNEHLCDEVQVFQWLLQCASELTFPFHAKQLAEYAIQNWCIWEKE